MFGTKLCRDSVHQFLPIPSVSKPVSRVLSGAHKCPETALPPGLPPPPLPYRAGSVRGPERQRELPQPPAAPGPLPPQTTKQRSGSEKVHKAEKGGKRQPGQHGSSSPLKYLMACRTCHSFQKLGEPWPLCPTLFLEVVVVREAKKFPLCHPFQTDAGWTVRRAHLSTRSGLAPMTCLSVFSSVHWRQGSTVSGAVPVGFAQAGVAETRLRYPGELGLERPSFQTHTKTSLAVWSPALGGAVLPNPPASPTTSRKICITTTTTTISPSARPPPPPPPSTTQDV